MDNPHSLILEQRQRAAAELAGLPIPEPVVPSALRLYDAPVPESTRCNGYDSGWLALVKMGLSVVRVLSSPPVDDLTFWTRMAACYECEHSEVGRDRSQLFCRCCRCPEWSKAALSSKNSHSAHACPRDPPAF